MKDLLEGLIAKFNAKVDADAALREELGDLTKVVLIDLKDGTKYHFTLRNQHVDRLEDGDVANPDIAIITDKDTLRALILREMGPFKAYALGRVKLKGSLEDLTRFRKFF